MAPVSIKYIVSFSSQDQCHKASNIVSGDGTKKWLSDCSDRSGKIEAILQLEEPCQLAYIDIGTIWCASLEVRVGRSDWPQTAEFLSLIPVVSLMTPVDCRLSRGSCVTKMFSKVDFSSDLSAQKWDRLQIICRQPFRKDVQLGISFIRLKSANPAPQPEFKPENISKQVNNENKTHTDVSSIQQHFFKKILNKSCERATPAAQLKKRLLKISGSAEFGSEHEQSLTRTAKLVLKASENSEAQKLVSPSPVTPKRGLFSDHLAKQKAVPIEEELKMYFPTLKINVSDIERLTVADLRHKFERKIRRKLTVEEKRTFSRQCEQFICTLLDGEDESDASFVSAVSHNATPVRSYDNQVEKNSSGTQEKEISPFGKGLETIIYSNECGSAKNCVDSPAFILNGKIGEMNPKYVSTPLYGNHSDKNNGLVETLKSPQSLPIVRKHILTSATTGATSNWSIFNDRPEANFSGASENVKGNHIMSEHNPSSRAVISKGNSTVDDESENDECLSSVTYDEEEEEQELSDNSDLTSPDSSPNILKSGDKQNHNLEKVRKSYERLYNLNASQGHCDGEMAESPQNSLSAKKRKLERISSHLSKGLTSEIIDVDEGCKIKGCNMQTAASSARLTDGPTSTNSEGINSSTSTELAVDSLPCKNVAATELMQKNFSPRTPKGKVYRMLTSPNVQSPKGQNIIRDQSCIKKDFRTRVGLDTVNERTNGPDSVCLPRLSAAPSTSTPAKISSAAFPIEVGFNSTKTTSKKERGRGRGRGLQKVPVQPKISTWRSRGRGRDKPGRKGSATGSHTTSGLNSGRSSMQAQEELIFCDKCYGEFPPDMYAGHYSFCVRPAVFEEEDDIDNNNAGVEHHEAMIDETVDYSECPICLERFPQDVLPVHASECGL
ncbi:Xrcc1-prov protein [Elysia marginata]|uniref:Xrcc1-prov protein n=1 Tax=Elysia marginata TaxID=1093978 RepID=A0AAV4JDL6_9GAST|nr:Xrcc1-prov protein [Elysia marginata]